MKQLKLFVSIVAFLLFNLQPNFAQQEPQSSLYMFNPLFFNPAYAGSRQTIHFVAHHRQQWVGIEGAPMTQFFSFDMPIKKTNLNIGVHGINDAIGARNNTSVFADVSYGFKLNRNNHRLALALSAGVDLYQVNYSQLPVVDPSDVNYANGNFFRPIPNIGVGIMYYGKNHVIGFSIPRLIGFSLNGNQYIGSVSNVVRHYYLMGSVNIAVTRQLDIKPSAIIKMTENAPFSFDLNPSLVWKKKFWAGFLYRFNESLGLNLGFYIGSSVHVGYAFDYPYNDLRLNNFGSHEILVGVDIGKRKRRPTDCFF